MLLLWEKVPVMRTKIVRILEVALVIVGMLSLQACFERQYYGSPGYGYASGYAPNRYGPSYYPPEYSYEPAYRQPENRGYESRRHEAHEEREEHERDEGNERHDRGHRG